jgi:hypothetical protein
MKSRGLVKVVRTCSTAEPGSRDPIYMSCFPPLTYQALYYHRPQGSAHGKSNWRTTRDDECHTFCVSTDKSWSDEGGNHWFVDANGEELGTRHERVAFFPYTSSLTGPWHGYPVSGRAGAVAQKHVPREILTLWQAQNAVPRQLLAKLWKRAA